jgi:hypothetical protein
LIDKVSPPYGFRQVQTADLSDWDGSPSHAELQSLVRGIGGLISKPVSEPLLSTGRTGSSKWPYLLAGGLVLFLLLSYAAYRLIKLGPDVNPNRVADSTPVAANHKPSGNATPCDADSRHKAAELTGKGMTFIDPGGNQAAAVLQFNEALSECAGYTDAYFLRGQSFAALQQNEKAIADFKRVLELTTDADMRRQAQNFVAGLEGPPPTPRPSHAPLNTNANTTNTGTSNANHGPLPSPIAGHAPVNDMFASDKSTRIAATTRLIIERKRDPETVQMSVKSALAHPENKSGVINTLVYLENVDPAILKRNRAEIEKLFEAAKGNGEQTADHIRKVQGLLNN